MMMPAPFFSRRAEQPIDFRLGADVDADGRLVEDEELGAVIEPFADHHLLLVAARETRTTGAAREAVLIWTSRICLSGGREFAPAR